MSSCTTAEFIGRDFTVSCSLHDPSDRSGRLTVSGLYNIVPRVCIGGEYLWEWYQGIKHHQIAIAGRYMSNCNVIAATMSRHGLDVTLWRKVTENLQIGSAFVLNKKKRERIAEIFYQWETDDVTVRGQVDSNLTLGFTYTK